MRGTYVSFRSRRLAISVAIFLACAASLALAQKHPQKNEASIYAVLNEAPEAARARANPFAGNPRETAAGRKLFEQHCAECHGKSGGGSMHGANLQREEVQQASPGALFWVLTNGVVWHGMPVWSKLPEPERWQIVTYLQSLSPQAAKPASKNAP